VSGNGAITAFDASLILRYAAGDTAGLNSRAGDWEFLCAEKHFDLAADVAASDYVAFLMGDVSGNWEPGEPLAPPSPGSSVFALSAAPDGDRVRVIVQVSGDAPLLALDAEFLVNPGVLQFLDARPIGDAAAFLLATRADGDRVRVAMAGVSGPTAGGFLELEFANVQGRSLLPDELPSLAWTRMNDGGVAWSSAAVPESAAAGVESARPAIVAIRPNPFNPSTEIQYSVPSSADVRLEVYGVGGHLVRVLVAARLEAGLHRATWDGRDGRGSAQPSGLYFARLTAGGTTQTQKLMLLK
jgi:hypothetical protein